VTKTEVNFDTVLPLPTVLGQSVRRISIERADHQKCARITLWHEAAEGVQIWSQMHDVAERLEIGVLSFASVSAGNVNEIISEFPRPLAPKQVWKLLIEKNGTVLESGVRFLFADACELVILPADFPFFLSILGNCVPVTNPRPEYDLDEYQQVKIFDSAEAR